MRLRKLIHYDSIAVYVNRNGWLLPELVSGENFKLLSSLKIRVGEGLYGWVAENGKPIINGNPQVEAGYSADPEKYTTLKSALAVPLEGLNGVVGVLAMYHSSQDAFTPDHLRILLAVASKVALSVENLTTAKLRGVCFEVRRGEVLGVSDQADTPGSGAAQDADRDWAD